MAHAKTKNDRGETMQDQVLMSPNSGALCVAIPLYRLHEQHSLGKLDGCMITMSDDKPIMYAVDVGDEILRAFNADWVESKLDFLGDL